MDNKLANSYFRKNFTKLIVKPLKSKGFKRYKTVNIARVVGDSIFQFLNFQKEAHGDKKFTVNIAIRPLYILKENLTLAPGDRINSIVGRNKWWSYLECEEAENSFQDINNHITSEILPIFDSLDNSTKLLEMYKHNDSKLMLPPSDCWKLYDMGFLYMRTGNYEKAIITFNDTINIFEEDKEQYIDHLKHLNLSRSKFEDSIKNYFANKAIDECNNALSIIENGEIEVKAYLERCEKDNRVRFSLVDF